ncbi:MAG TPA: S-layer homology domain-containing protein [Pseudobacteroides sp.]|uniref:S-layer homology domain-containing protein n=1 Tax=Pseudobacteroides sp. TaxID=1968840 RepID=UPI002F9302B1
MTVPRYTDFYLGYILPEKNSLYYEMGFYSGYQTVQNPYNAAKLNIYDSYCSGLNLMILSKMPTPDNNIPPPVILTPPTATRIPTPTTTPKPTITPTPTAQELATKQPSSGNEDSNNMPTDVSDHWAKDYIVKLISKGFVSGYQDGTIRPDKDITRAEITKLIAKMLYLEPSNTSTKRFADSSKFQDWAKGYINAISEDGIIMGYKDNTFRPNNKLTRMEMVVIILRALGYKDLKQMSLDFKDKKAIPDWASGYVAKAVELSIVNGYQDGSFKPNKNITRAEAFTIIIKGLELKKVIVQ